MSSAGQVITLSDRRPSHGSSQGALRTRVDRAERTPVSATASVPVGRPRAVRVQQAGVQRAGVQLARVQRAGGSLRLTRRGRVVVWVVASTLAVGVGMAAQSAAADAPGATVAVTRHVVAPGETLWGIAASLAAPGQDVRDVVDELSEMNRLDDAGLVVGAELVLPVR